MEKKSNKKFVITIIILIILLLGVSGYMVYDKFLTKTEEKKLTSETTQEQEANNNKDNSSSDNNSNSNNFKVLTGNYSDSATTIILYNSEVYISFDPCPVNMGSYNGMYKEYCSSINNITNSYKEYNFDVLEYESINATQSYRYEKELSSKFLGLKLNISEIKSVYSIMQGQAITPNSQGLALLKHDGTLAVISFQNIIENQLTPTVTTLKNITRIENKINDNGISSLAIDNSGNEYNLDKYLK